MAGNVNPPGGMRDNALTTLDARVINRKILDSNTGYSMATRASVKTTRETVVVDYRTRLDWPYRAGHNSELRGAVEVGCRDTETGERWTEIEWEPIATLDTSAHARDRYGLWGD